jgi:phospholipid-binding lipoprotein MlaA
MRCNNTIGLGNIMLLKSLVILALLTFSVQLALGATNEVLGNNDVDDSDQITEDVSSDNDGDPLRSVNKVTHGFNSVVDKILLRPLAKGYKTITPKFMQSGVRNFFANLADVNNSVNNLLQGKVKASVSDVSRILVNTTVGIGGLIDPASSMGLARHNEDFGQTLRKWGVPKGPYLVIPFLGPSTLTDFVARRLDPVFDPVRYLYPVDHRNIIFGVNAIVRRSEFLAAEEVVFGDKYIFYREAYLQRREYLAKDGKVEDAFDDF